MTSPKDEKTQLTIRTERWVMNAIQDDAAKNGLDPEQMNAIINRALRLYVSERGYSEPTGSDTPEIEAVRSTVTALCQNDHSAALKLLQTITEALAGHTAKVGAVLIC